MTDVLLMPPPVPWWTTAVIVPLVTASLYFLAARARVFAAPRGRLPSGVLAFLRCPACVGFWLWLAAGLVLFAFGWPFLGLPGRWIATPLVLGLIGVVVNPWLTYGLTYALTYDHQLAEGAAPTPSSTDAP